MVSELIRRLEHSYQLAENGASKLAQYQLKFSIDKFLELVQSKPTEFTTICNEIERR